jgi:AcrR family transcriptional regulator
MPPAVATRVARATSRPHGRVEITAAVLDAAAELFGRRGPSGVSVRDIATEANVQHSVVHRYFRTKDELFREVVRRGSAAEAARQTAGRTTTQLIEDSLADPRWARALIWASLDGRDMRDLYLDDRVETPVVAAATAGDARIDDGLPGLDPRVVAAVLGAATFGWAAMGETLVAANGLEDMSDEELHHKIAQVLTRTLGLADPGAI